MAVGWREALLEQARSDFETAELLLVEVGKRRIDRCQLLHYFQMALEKAAKAAKLPAASLSPPPRTHAGATDIVRLVLLGHSQFAPLRQQLAMSPAQLSAFLKSLLPTILAVERLAPALAKGGANAEYPWTLPNSSAVQSPAAFAFPEPALHEARVARLAHFLRILLRTLR